MKVNRYDNSIMLSKLDKDILRLYNNGFKAKSIATELNVSVSSVYNRIHRLRQCVEVKRWWDN